MLLAAVLIGVDVTLRKFFETSIGGADELAGYALALGTAWSLGATLLERAHIRIDSLYVLFPRWLRLALDFVGIALLLAFFGLIARHGWDVVQQSWVSGSRSQSALGTPIVIPQAIWLVGLALFFLVGLALLAYAAALIARGNAAVAAATWPRRRSKSACTKSSTPMATNTASPASHIDCGITVRVCSADWLCEPEAQD